MRALLARKVDVAWLLLVTALSGAVLVVWIALQSGSVPGGKVYIVQAAATSVAGQGGAQPARSAAGSFPVPTSVERTQPQKPSATLPTNAAIEATPPIEPTTFPTSPTLPAGVRLDINRATAAELEALPGIGPVLAQRIVQDREANGLFATVDDLDRVNGIGAGIIAKVRDHVTAGP
jgi:competence protein ComEA